MPVANSHVDFEARATACLFSYYGLSRTRFRVSATFLKTGPSWTWVCFVHGIFETRFRLEQVLSDQFARKTNESTTAQPRTRNKILLTQCCEAATIPFGNALRLDPVSNVEEPKA